MNSPLTAISETVGDALSAGTGIVYDLGSTAAEKLPELPDTVNRLAHRAQRRFRPPKKRFPTRPVVLIAIALAAVAAVIVWRRRSSNDEQVSHVPPREYTEQASAAAGAN